MAQSLQARSRQALRAFRNEYDDAAPRVALGALDEVEDIFSRQPEWQAERARLLRLAGDLAGAESILRPLVSAGDPATAAEYATVLAAIGHPTDALAVVDAALAAAPDHQRLGALWSTLQKRVHGAAVANASIARRVRKNDGSISARSIADLANGLTDEGRPAVALGLLRDVTVEEGVAAATVHLAAARAKAAVGDHASARESLTAAVLELTPRPLFNAVSSTLSKVMLPDRPPRTIESIILRLRQDDRLGAAVASRLTKSSADPERVIEDYAPEGQLADATPARLLPLLYALHDLGQYDEMRAHVEQAGDLEAFGAQDLQNLIQVTSCLADPALTARLSTLALERGGFGPLDPEGLVLRANSALTSGGISVVVRDLIACERAGRMDADLCYYLCLHGERLAESLDDAALATELTAVVRKARNILKTHAAIDPVLRERRVEGLVMQALGRAPDALVSILIPVHRQEDLKTIRENLLAQSWTQIEAIVMPNGPLAGTGAAEAALGDLPFVRILEVRPGTIGALLNQGIDVARGDYVLRFDSDDTYLRDYVTNTVSLLHASGADFCCKPAMFVHVEAIDMVVLQDEGHPFSDTGGGNGATQAFTASVLKTHRYAENLIRSEDANLSKRILRDGGRMVTAPPFDFVATRHADKALHTWHLGDFHLYGSRQFIGSGAVIPALGSPVFE